MKKFVAALSILSVLSTAAVPAFADDHGKGHGKQQIKTHFTTNTNIKMDDINGHWAEKFILDLLKKGVLNGVDAHHFNPNDSVSRAQWAVMVTRYFDLQTTATTQDFTDVPVNAWEYKYVEAVKNYFDAYRGLNGSLSFHPDAAATRQDVTVTLVKVLTELDPSISVMDSASAEALLKQQFTDYTKISPALRPYVATAVQNDLIHGDGKGHFNPLQSLSRAEAATLLDLMLQNGIVVGDDQSTNPTDPTVPSDNTKSHVTDVTTLSSTLVTAVDNTQHKLTVQNGLTASALESILKVDGGKGTVQVYTDSTKTTAAADDAALTDTMVVEVTAQDGTTKVDYTIGL
ncbi:S-layer homology domain-containing protein [Tumebacillus flagellatus]|uniref:SLH domain-containing protein n=1 Tax=Tumebacillus flagellatus TaxID=1157490 RepID=A0A074LUW7_9BACL|nr:S-layer homology domain-containing protein [Tumebacillus flagellatus]KEO84729.1 hypothetical protein EL26_04220 [Tumebacillus flagellatus]